MFELPDRIEKLKDLHLETVLARGKRSASVIVAPPNGAGDAAAARLQEVVRKRWGVEIPVALGDGVTTSDLLSKANVVALGCMADNPFIERLYFEQYTLLDRWYPGPGGHVLRSLHNPYGTGHNVIFCGGSDSKGIDASADGLIARLSEAERPALGWLEDVVLGKGHARPRGDRIPGDLLVFYGPPRKKLGLNEASQLALRYHYTGDVKWAEAFKKAALKTHLLETCDHYWSHKMYPAWDLIEESPAFSDEERLEVTNRLLAHLRSPESAGSAGVLADFVLKAQPRDRHAMARAMNVLLGCRYFSRGYAGDCWAPLLDLVDRYWAVQMRSSKGMSGLTFGVSSYLDLALDHALLTGNRTFCESGAFRVWAERLFPICNNLGFEVMAGQYSAEQFPEAALSKAAHLLRDGRFLHLKSLRDRARKGQGVYNVTDFGSGQAFAGDVTPAPAGDMTGVVVSPADRTYFDAFTGRPIPFEEAFDKLTFRSGFEPEDQFLTLNGICSGTKFFPDINAIQEWSEHGRVLMTTCDSGVQTEGVGLRAANTICVTVNGESGPTPTAASLVLRAEMGRLAHTHTVARDHGTADWSRHLFWVRGAAFLVVDVLQTKRAGDYAFRCQWRCLGEVEASGRDTRLRLGPAPTEEGPRTAHILSAGTEEVTLFRDLPLNGEEGGAGRAFAPYAGLTLNQVHQTTSLKMDQGDWVVFANLLYSEPESHPAEGLFREVEDGVYAFSAPVAGYAGLAPEGETLSFRRGDLTLSAGSFLLARGEVLLTEARSLSILSETLTVSVPVTLHADLLTGAVEVETPEPVEMTLPAACAGRVRLNGRTAFLKQADDKATMALPAGHHRLAGVFASGPAVAEGIEASARGEAVPAPPVPSAPAVIAGGAPVWSRVFEVGPASPEADRRIPPPEGGITAVWADRAPDPQTPFAVVGLRDGQVAALDPEGRTLWAYRAGDAVCAVAALDAGGARRVLVGSDDATLTCLDAEGRTVWQRDFPASEHTLAYPWWNLLKGRVRSLAVVDLDGDGRPEIAVGTGGALVHLLDADGNERWRHPMRWGLAQNAFAIDLNGDGRRELLVGMDRLTMTSRLHVFASDGTVLPQQYTKQWPGETVRNPSWEQTGASVVDYLNRNGGRPPLILVGRSGAFNQLSAYDAVTEAHIWKREVGDRTSGMVVADIDRDGNKDVAISTHAGWVICYDAAGKRRWAAFLGSPVTTLCRSSLRGSQLAAGTFGGKVYLVDSRGRAQPIRSEASPVTRLVATHRGAKVLCAAGDGVHLI
ncbi:MAG: hypothetical protein EXS64_03145 [Candidatus Latescibacteria bacterium]|nr:hypothetical protein [Candidatus Latescibacterota bacterium]